MMKHHVFILFFLFCVLNTGYANESHWEIFSGEISKYYETMAVNGKTVCIFSDIGIHYFDIGASVFHNYFNRDYNLPDEEVTHARFDSQGTLWCVTSQRIYSFNTSSIMSLDNIPDIDFSELKDFVIDGQDTKWFLFRDSLWKFNDTSWNQFTIPADKALCFAVDENSHLWVGTREDGLWEFDGTDWQQHILEDVAPYGIRSVTVDKTNKKWMTTYKKVLLTFTNDTWETIEFYEGSGPYDYITATQGSILYKSSRNKITRLRGDKVLFSDIIEFNAEFLAIAPGENSYWILTGEGLFILNDYQREYMCYGHPWLLDSYIKRIAWDENRNCIWATHGNPNATPKIVPVGLSQFDGNTWKTPITYDIYLSEELEHNNTEKRAFGTSLLVLNGIVLTNYHTSLIMYDGFSMSLYHGFIDHLDRGGLIWDVVPDIRPGFTNYYWICQHFPETTTQSAAITWFKPSIPEIYDLVALNGASKTCLAWDNNARLWAGSSSGLLFIGRPIYFADEDYTRLKSINKYIVCMAFDNNNKLWMGIAEPYNKDKAEGLLCFSLDENTTSIPYDVTNSELPSNIINTILFDNNDIMWIGTDAGVTRFDGETWTTFNTQNSGLCDNKVNAIAVEKNNTIWFGTDNGVSRYTGEIITTSVHEGEQTPESLPLIKTYPNPFNPSTTIEFTLPESGYATVTIYSLTGQKIRELTGDFMPVGTHTLLWDGRDTNGNAVSSGIYITRLQAGKHTATGRMVLVR